MSKLDQIEEALENAKAEIISRVDPNTETNLTLNDVDVALTALSELRQERERMRETLKYYANIDKYCGHDPELIWGDKGQRARAALGESNR